jgi:predicted phage tail protein
MGLSGSVIFNHVIIDAFGVAGFLLVMIGIFQVLSSKTTQKNGQTTERTPA